MPHNKNIITELIGNSRATLLFQDVLNFIRTEIKKRNLTNLQVVNFHDQLKLWTLRSI